MAHYTKKKKTNERKITKEKKTRAEYIMCFECEAQGSRFLCHTENVSGACGK